MKKRSAFILAAVLSLLILCGCARSGASLGRYQYGVTAYQYGVTGYQYGIAGAQIRR